jgi:hypothetical protein
LNAGNRVEQAYGFIIRFVSPDLSGLLDTATRQLALPATQAHTLFQEAISKIGKGIILSARET